MLSLVGRVGLPKCGRRWNDDGNAETCIVFQELYTHLAAKAWIIKISCLSPQYRVCSTIDVRASMNGHRPSSLVDDLQYGSRHVVTPSTPGSKGRELGVSSAYGEFVGTRIYDQSKSPVFMDQSSFDFRNRGSVELIPTPWARLFRIAEGGIRKKERNIPR